jgi:nucleoside-diphosphate-sugar epimerase
VADVPDYFLPQISPINIQDQKIKTEYPSFLIVVTGRICSFGAKNSQSVVLVNCPLYIRFMNIAIIGTGWLGHPLAQHLHNSGKRVYGSRRSAFDPGTDSYIPFVYPGENGNAILQKADVAVLAFPPNRTAADQYAEDCLDVCTQLKQDCQIILISSTGVYAGEGVLTEEDPLPETTGNAVAAAEKALTLLPGREITIVRMAGLVGPERYPARAMSQSGKTYAGNEPVNVIHLADAVNLIAFLIENNVRGEIVNGCASGHPPKEIYYTKMAEQLGIPPPLFNSDGLNGKIISSEKSRKMGFEYKYDDPFSFVSVGD